MKILYITLMLTAWNVMAADWPTVHQNVQRSGYTTDSPAPPFQKVWRVDLCLENIDTGAEAILADGQVFVGTFAGNLYALSQSDGSVTWKQPLGDVIIGAPAYAEGKIVVPALNGLHVLRADTGEMLWTKKIKYGFRASPAVDDGVIYLGSRQGDMLAFDLNSGAILWQTPMGAPIYASAALTEDKVIIAAEDGRGYALQRSNGRVLWKTGTMYAYTFRYFYPLIWQDEVLFLTEPAINNHGLRSKGYQHICTYWGETNSLGSGKMKFDAQKWPVPEEQLQEELGVITQWLKEDARRKSVWAFDLETGRETAMVPFLFTAGNAGIRCAGAVNPAGWFFSWSGSYFNRWTGRYPYSLNAIHVDTRDMKLMNYAHWHPQAPRVHGDSFEYNEIYNATIGRDRLYIAHSDNIWGLNLTNHVAFHIAGKRDFLGGVYGDINGKSPITVDGVDITRCPNEWHGTGRGGLSISGNRIFWLAGGMVQCFEGSTHE